MPVNGNNVTAYGLAVEHYQQDETVWNGQGGTVIFYQNEKPLRRAKPGRLHARRPLSCLSHHDDYAAPVLLNCPERSHGLIGSRRM